jgi:hydrogenase maturation protein HypF
VTNQSDQRIIRIRLTIQGIVQGVGFRPFVYSLAKQKSLTGFVGNDSAGLFVEVQGKQIDLAVFSKELIKNKPPLAIIDSISESVKPVCEESGFIIVESENASGLSTPVSPDISLCEECYKELLNLDDRRYQYPFINCTNCGPRFTIIKDIPYDRPKTTMSQFEMCAECQQEYDDPLNRRYHAQPNACPVCGPSVWFVTGDQINEPENFSSPGFSSLEHTDPIFAAQQMIKLGNVVAIKGIGGFHLACDATSDEAVQKLRVRKGRIEKPFAVMVTDLESAKKIAHVNNQEAQLLLSRERPIVLLRKRNTNVDERISQFVAPGNDSIGVFLPYSPLHCLLVQDKPLVMTSGNMSDEPIVHANLEAKQRLAQLADGFLLHDREIHIVCDDSVTRILDNQEYPVRRSRGYAPMPVRLPEKIPSILATGGELKSTFCLTKENYAYLSQHIGDMGNMETIQAFESSVVHFKKLFRSDPEVIACDEHPGYLSSKWARKHADENNLLLVPVQHHHAHIASLMAEHGMSGEEQVLGVSFDGTGYGRDGAIWGGEILLSDYQSFERKGFLKYIPLPGGDAAIKRPYRIAIAHLWSAGVDWNENLPCVAACQKSEQKILRQQLEKNIQTVPTSSMGRLFDAVASILGIRQIVSYEAQAVIEMESMCYNIETEMIEKQFDSNRYQFKVIPGEPFKIDSAPVIKNIVEEFLNGTDRIVIAYRFHLSVARMITEVCMELRKTTKVNTVALSGGVFQNVLLTKLARANLQGQGFKVLIHRLVPPNDGGLSLGQAIIASKKLPSNRFR